MTVGDLVREYRLLGSSIVSWGSSAPNYVTLWSTEAEFAALGDGVKEALFVRSVIYYFVPSLSEKCSEVFVGNKRTIAVGNNPLSLARAKRIDVRFHFIRKLVRSKTISVEYVQTKQ